MLADMATRLVPREAATSIDELIARASERGPLGGTDGKSGATLERVVIDGEPFVHNGQMYFAWVGPGRGMGGPRSCICSAWTPHGR